MNTFAGALTRQSLCSLPTILVAVSWAVIANLGDAAYNGMEHPLERGIGVTILVLGQFGITWIVDRLALGKLTPRRRTLALLSTFILAGALRGVGVAYMMYALGVSAEFSVSGRMIGATIQSLEVALFAFAYGLLIANARQLRDLAGIGAHLQSLSDQAASVREDNDAALIDRVRSELRSSLDWGAEETPGAVLETLNRSIEDIVRPLSRTLTNASEPTIPEPSRTWAIDWRMVWREAMNAENIQLRWTLSILFVVISVPSVGVFGVWGFGISLVLTATLGIAMFVTILLARLIPSFRSWSTLAALAAGSMALMTGFWFLYPSAIRWSYISISTYAVALAGLTPTFVGVALKKARVLTQQLAEHNEQLVWTIARTNEITRQRRAAVATALHSTVQAALVGAHLRLQVAIRDEANVDEAVATAKAEAEHAIVFGIEADQPPETKAAIDALAESWTGVVDVRSELATDSTRIDADPVCARAVADIVAESVLNAVKHGGAEWVSISCDWPGERLVRITIKNSAPTAAKTSGSGGGTQLLDGACIAWSRTTEAGVTTLVATLPWQAQ